MRPYEWTVIFVLGGFLAFIGLTTHYITGSTLPAIELPPHYILEQEIEVMIQGAVQNPGVYKVPRDSRLKDLLALAVTLPNANLNRIKPDSKLRQGQRINIPAYKERKVATKKNKPAPNSQENQFQLIVNEDVSLNFNSGL